MANDSPLTMIELATVAYDSPRAIPAKLLQVTHHQWQCVWGPVALYSDLDIVYSLLYIAQKSGTNEFAFVIRGTTWDSMTAWLDEDFKIDTQVPWNNYYYKAADDIKISRGSANGFKDLLGMEDAARGHSSWLSVLTRNPGATVYVTGHSLGGTLTPVLAAYIWGLSDIYQLNLSIQPYSFAGLTPGNPAFAAFVDSLFPSSVPWRFHNTLDIAPLLWNNLHGVYTIYDAHGLAIPDYVKDILDYKTEGIPAYGQPDKSGMALPGQFQQYDYLAWEREGYYQHHTATYLALIQAQSV